MIPAGPIALLGMRCSGKTTVGRRLARLLRRPFVDADERTLEQGRYAGFTAAAAGELLERVGLATFRDLEAAALRAFLEPGQWLVIATGGGAVEHSDSRAWLRRSATCIWLDVDASVLQERLRADPTLRPALAGEDAVAEVPSVLARRRPLYATAAAIHLECGTRSADELAEAIRARLES